MLATVSKHIGGQNI